MTFKVFGPTKGTVLMQLTLRVHCPSDRTCHQVHEFQLQQIVHTNTLTNVLDQSA